MPGTVVRLRAVSVRYAGAPGNRAALDQVDLAVTAGQRVALLGPSGAGKSTLLALCSGGVRPGSGDVEVLGVSLQHAGPAQLAAVRRRVGAIHQGLHLVRQLRVVHNVNAGHLGRWSWWQALVSLVRPLEVATAREALARTGVEDKLFVRTDRLSGGEQQRVAIARVLVQDPDLVLADEPVAGLDPSRAEEVMALLCDTLTVGDRTLLVSLHDVDLAVRYCDRIVGMRGGRVLFDLPAEAVDERIRSELYALEPS